MYHDWARNMFPLCRLLSMHRHNTLPPYARIHPLSASTRTLSTRIISHTQTRNPSHYPSLMWREALSHYHNGSSTEDSFAPKKIGGRRRPMFHMQCREPGKLNSTLDGREEDRPRKAVPPGRCGSSQLPLSLRFRRRGSTKTHPPPI